MAERIANDGWDDYYRFKFRELIPDIYWREDEGGALASLVDAVAFEAAQMRRSHDRSWENQTPELADDWILPYLGELLATRMLESMDTRAKRVDVAKAIYYRRRSGTPRVLEEIAGDVSGWPTVLREAMLSLIRTPHRLDVEVPPSTPDMKNRQVAFTSGSAFDVAARTPDMRRARGTLGRYNIKKLLFHAYSTPVYRIEGAQPASIASGPATLATFNPSGRRVQLYSRPRVIDDWDQWEPAAWTDVPQPLSCPELNDVVYRIDEDVVDEARDLGLSAGILTRLASLDGVEVESDPALSRVLTTVDATLSDGASFEALRRVSLRKSGRYVFVVAPETTATFELWTATSEYDRHAIVGADLGGAVPAVTTPDALVDPQLGLIEDREESLERVSYHYGWPGPVGAGPYTREFLSLEDSDVDLSDGGALDATTLPASGVVEFRDDSTWDVSGSTDVDNLIVRARRGTRGFQRLDDDWVLEAIADSEGALTLEGLWLGAPPAATRTLRILGDFEDLRLDHVSIDPGDDESGRVDLVIEGSVERLTIRRSILGQIRVDGAVEYLDVLESILMPASGPAIDAGDATSVSLERCTVVGDLDVHRLSASNTLTTGDIQIADLQRGCFRYSAALEGLALPSPYQVVRLSAEEIDGLFDSTRFSNARLLRLSIRASVPLKTGADDGEEIGVWGMLAERRRLENIEYKIREYLPIGMIPVLIREN